MREHHSGDGLKRFAGQQLLERFAVEVAGDEQRPGTVAETQRDRSLVGRRARRRARRAVDPCSADRVSSRNEPDGRSAPARLRRCGGQAPIAPPTGTEPQFADLERLDDRGGAGRMIGMAVR